MWIAWTTVAQRADADRLARIAVEHGLAVCAQIDGPVTSVFRWKNQIETGTEWRITFKCSPEQFAPLEQRIVREHPYETPEWLAVRAEHVGEKYLNWAIENSSLGLFSNKEHVQRTSGPCPSTPASAPLPPSAPNATS